MTRERLLPWLLGRADLGDRVLEIGAGAGAATAELRKRASHVVSLEYDSLLVTRLAQWNGNGAGIVQGDAASLPFADRTFSSAVAVLALHHLRSSEQQDRAFAEVHRVLQPGGTFLRLKFQMDGSIASFTPTARLCHSARFVAARLATAGFGEVVLDRRPGGFSFRASPKS